MDKVLTTIVYSNEKLNWKTGTFDTSCLSNNYCCFELIEDEIDIQSIKEIDTYKARDKIFTYTGNEGEKNNLYCLSLYVAHNILDKLNKHTQAIKQLDRKIKEG